MPDSLSPAAHVLLSMSEEEYLLLLLKLLGVAAGLLASAVALFASLFKAGQFTWRLMLASLRADLAASFCTPAQLATAISEAMERVTERLDDGDERMKRIEGEAKETREEVKMTRASVEQMNRRFLRIMSLLVTHGDNLSLQYEISFSL